MKKRNKLKENKEMKLASKERTKETKERKTIVWHMQWKPVFLCGVIHPEDGVCVLSPQMSGRWCVIFLPRPSSLMRRSSFWSHTRFSQSAARRRNPCCGKSLYRRTRTCCPDTTRPRCWSRMPRLSTLDPIPAFTRRMKTTMLPSTFLCQASVTVLQKWKKKSIDKTNFPYFLINLYLHYYHHCDPTVVLFRPRDQELRL